MPEIDPVILQLRADVAKYRVDVENVTRRVNGQLDSQGKAVVRLENQIRQSTSAISSSFKSMAAGLAAGFSAREVANMADSYTRFTNQLKVAGLEGGNLVSTQERLFEVAQKNGVELESVGTLYSRAAQNQKELGASTDDLIGLTRAVAASLRISGTSTNEASGALLQLGQALGSPRIQAEEFNSLLDTMQPLLRGAAKYIDGTGDSLSGLTRKIKDQKGPGVSNVELFRAITQAMADLERQASATTLTIGGAFTALSNAITKYIGEADQANGATVVVTGALNLLAENLDTVTEAIALLSAVMLGRFVSGMVAGAASTGIVSVALSAVQARAAGTITTMEALAVAGSTAGRALLAAFGGPVGIAVTALTVGIGYLAVSNAKAEAASASLSASIEAQTAQFADLRAKQAAAAAETDNLTGKQRAALTATANLTGEANLLATAWGRVAAQAKSAAVEQAKATLYAARNNVNAARTAYQEKRDSAFRSAPRPFAERGLGRNLAPNDPAAALKAAEKAAEAERQKYQEATLNVQDARREYDRIRNEKLATFKPSDIAAAPAAVDKKKSKSSAATGKSAADIEAQYQQELSRLNIEELQAKLDLATSATERADLQRQIFAEEKAQRIADIKANKDLSEKQKAAQIAAIEKLYGAAPSDSGDITVQPGLLQRRVSLEEQEQLAREALDRAQASAQNDEDLLRAQEELATTREQRRDIELRILDITYEQERAEIEAVLASQTATQAQKDIAAARLKILDQLKGYDAAKINRDNEGPLASYARSLSETSINDQVEGYVVDELKSVQDSIASGLQKAIGTKDPLISGLINLFIQEVIMKPIAAALAQATANSGAGGSGSFFSTIASGIGALLGGGGSSTLAPSADFSGVSMAGFASGGYTGDGHPRQPAGIVHKGEYVMPADAVRRVGVQNLAAIANGRAAAAMAGDTAARVSPVQQTVIVHVEASEYFDARVDSRAARVAAPIAAQQAKRAAGASYAAGQQSAPGTIFKYNQLKN